MAVDFHIRDFFVEGPPAIVGGTINGAPYTTIALGSLVPIPKEYEIVKKYVPNAVTAVIFRAWQLDPTAPPPYVCIKDYKGQWQPLYVLAENINRCPSWTDPDTFLGRQMAATYGAEGALPGSVQSRISAFVKKLLSLIK